MNVIRSPNKYIFACVYIYMILHHSSQLFLYSYACLLLKMVIKIYLTILFNIYNIVQMHLSTSISVRIFKNHSRNEIMLIKF